MDATNATAAKPQKHLAFLDSLRGLAALYVLLHHSFQQFHFPEGSLLQKITMPFMFGHWAVDLFIVLSGFCLMLPVIRNEYSIKDGSLNFFKRRAKRILPSYYLALLFSLLLIYTIIGEKTGTHWDACIPVSQWDVVTHLLLLQDIFTDTSAKINHAFWSISVEWRIYFLFPLLVWLWKKWGAVHTTFLSVTLSLLTGYALLYTDLNMTSWGINPQYLGLFTIGMLSASIANEIASPERTLNWKPTAVLSLVVGCYFCLSYYLEHNNIVNGKSMVFDVVLGMLIGGFLVLLSVRKLRFIHSLLSWKPLVFLGSFAYSIYLLHAPLIQVFWQYVLTPLQLSTIPSAVIFTTVGSGAILVCCYLFYLIAERPFLGKRKMESGTQKQPAYKEIFQHARIGYFKKAVVHKKQASAAKQDA